MKRRRVSFINVLSIFGILALSSCSKVSLIYRFADTVVVSAVDKYFDLESDQKAKAYVLVKKELKTLLKYQVPKINAYGREYLSITRKQNINRADLALFSDKGRDLLLSILGQFEGTAFEFTKDLKPRQFEYYKKKVMSDIDADRKRLKSKEQRIKTLKSRFDFGFYIIGLEMNSAQKKLYEDFLEKSDYPFDLELNNRVIMSQGFIDSSKSSEKLKLFIHQLFSKPLSMRDTAFQKAFDAYKAHSLEFQFKLLHSLTEKQQIRIESKVRDLIQQLQDLRVSEGFTLLAPKPCHSFYALFVIA